MTSSHRTLARKIFDQTTAETVSSSHLVLDSNVLNSLPWLVIEEMKEGYKGTISKEILHIKRMGHINRVHAVQFSSSGCYIGKDFGKNPHYTVPAKEFEEVVRKRCFDLGIMVKIYSNTRPISSSGILTVFSMDNGDLGKIGELVRKLTASLDCSLVAHDEEDSLTNDMNGSLDFDTPSYNKQRGAQQRHFGYSSNYSLKRLPTDQGGRVCPRLIGGGVTSEMADVFQAMTELGDEMSPVTRIH